MCKRTKELCRIIVWEVNIDIAVDKKIKTKSYGNTWYIDIDFIPIEGSLISAINSIQN